MTGAQLESWHAGDADLRVAAQGTDGRIFPWGNQSWETGDRNENGGGRGDSTRTRTQAQARRQTAYIPPPSHGRRVPSIPDVGSYSPAGDSPYGVHDAVGLLWQFTDEFVDAHTDAVILKGSSVFNPILSGDFPALPQVGNW